MVNKKNRFNLYLLLDIVLINHYFSAFAVRTPISSVQQHQLSLHLNKPPTCLCLPFYRWTCMSFQVLLLFKVILNVGKCLIKIKCLVFGGSKCMCTALPQALVYLLSIIVTYLRICAGYFLWIHGSCSAFMCCFLWLCMNLAHNLTLDQ